MYTLGVGTVVRNAFGVLFSNLHIAILIAAICGGLGWIITSELSDAVAHSLQISGRTLAVVAVLLQTLLMTVWGGVVGSWAAPAQIYLWVQKEKSQDASLSGAINYGLNRFGRVLSAHFRALAAVNLGMIIVVPGVLFGLQYAFVDAIATLDAQEKSVLRRSARLTSARRGTIFRTMCVFLLWWLPFQLIGAYLLPTAAWYIVGLVGLFDHLVLILVDLCMVQYYLDLFRKPAETTSTEAAAVPAT